MIEGSFIPAQERLDSFTIEVLLPEQGRDLTEVKVIALRPAQHRLHKVIVFGDRILCDQHPCITGIGQRSQDIGLSQIFILDAEFHVLGLEERAGDRVLDLGVSGHHAIPDAHAESVAVDVGVGEELDIVHKFQAPWMAVFLVEQCDDGEDLLPSKGLVLPS